MQKCPDTSDAAKIVIIGLLSLAGLWSVGLVVLVAIGKIVIDPKDVFGVIGAIVASAAALLATTGRKTVEPQEVLVTNQPENAVPVTEEKP